MRRNFWIDENGQPKYHAVLKSEDDIVLLDRRKLTDCSTELRYRGGPYKWAVYNATDTKYFGEWNGFKTKKAAEERFESLKRIMQPWKTCKPIREYPPKPDETKIRLWQNGGAAGPFYLRAVEFHKWAWSTTFGQWSALVTLENGWHGYTYPARISRWATTRIIKQLEKSNESR